ncbi:hypothetical protein G6O67_001956 [Ophiocordyceps sinensis]|uniref:Uncharacterized protein n=1 Tax=Ophiocordyceps sinensis TaxID=72228 RepID=A0A8H4PTB5_9HYPO|nr:hypothetical protein G6O67_001956 [Ophiocordyceps sinensis]
MYDTTHLHRTTHGVLCVNRRARLFLGGDGNPDRFEPRHRPPPCRHRPPSPSDTGQPDDDRRRRLPSRPSPRTCAMEWPGEGSASWPGFRGGPICGNDAPALAVDAPQHA